MWSTSLSLGFSNSPSRRWKSSLVAPTSAVVSLPSKARRCAISCHVKGSIVLIPPYYVPSLPNYDLTRVKTQPCLR
ncbi:unnamed protein product, partial [Citrullus colocynthis]